MLLYLDFNVCHHKKSLWKIELMNYDHFIYAIILMHVIQIIDAMSFAYYNLIKDRYFLCKIKYHDLSLLLTKCILLEVGQVYTHIG